MAQCATTPIRNFTPATQKTVRGGVARLGDLSQVVRLLLKIQHVSKLNFLRRIIRRKDQLKSHYIFEIFENKRRN